MSRAKPRMCDACGFRPVFRDGSFVSKHCIGCSGRGRDCESCGTPTLRDDLHVWQPPTVIAFACSGSEYHVCETCLDKLPHEEVSS